MKQVRVTGFGGPDRLELVELATPTPGRDQVLVRIEAAALNFSDLLQREGTYLGGPKPPFVPGSEAAGVVETCGAGVSESLAGTRVLLVVPGGLHASHCLVEAGACHPYPGSLEPAQAAALPVSALTAYHSLETVGRAQPGETVLIQAGAGGLGSAAIQIARLLQLRVIATASTEEKRSRCLKLGAHQVLPYEGMRKSGLRLDVVLETVGGVVQSDSLRLLAPFGRLVVVGCSSGEPRPIDPISLLFRSQAVLGFHLSAVLSRPDLLGPSLKKILAWAAAGELVPQLGRRLPLEAIQEGHRLLASRGTWGKVLLCPTPGPQTR